MPFTPETDALIREYAMARAVLDASLALKVPELAKDPEAFSRAYPEVYEYILGFHGFSRSRWHQTVAEIVLLFKAWGDNGRAKEFWERCLFHYYRRLEDPAAVPKPDDFSHVVGERLEREEKYGEPAPEWMKRWWKERHEPLPQEYTPFIAWQISQMKGFLARTVPEYIDPGSVKAVTIEDMVSPGWEGS